MMGFTEKLMRSFSA